MKIDKKQVEYIANLARISLAEDEKNEFIEQLGRIIEYVEKLNELDTSHVEPMAHATGQKSVFRDDIRGESLSADEALQNAPAREADFFKVPKVV